MDISLKLSDEPNGPGLIDEDLVRKLIEVARRANEGWRAYELPDDVEQSLKDALDALPDWITED